jgi:broad specificity phosphatase PhoE
MTAKMSADHPTLYYIRHGETDWNVAGRLQGGQDIPLNARGRAQATRCGEILRDLFARDGRDPAALDYVSSPLGRARVTMELARAAMGLPPDAYSVEPQLTEISFGAWEGYTIAEMRARDPQGTVQREQDKWHFLAPGGESYKMVAVRMGAWYETLTRDTVAAAHGGTARGLMAYLGIAKPAAAPLIDIEQGVVYVFEGGKLSRYA